MPKRLANGGGSCLPTDETGLGTDREGNFVHALLAAVVVDVVSHVENGIGFLVFGHATWAGEGHALFRQFMLMYDKTGHT